VDLLNDRVVAWVLSAVTVFITSGSVVKKAWKRQVANKVAWPSLRA